MTEHERALAVAVRALRLRGRSPATVKAVRWAARSFLADLGKPLGEITQQDVRNHLARRSRRGLAPVSQAARLTRLRTFFRSLTDAGLRVGDPTQGLRVQPSGLRPQLVLAPEAVAALLRAALDPARYPASHQASALALRDRALLELLYGVGLRRSEASGLLALDLRLQDGALLVRRAKRGPRQDLPLPRASLVPLRRYLREGRPVLAREPADHLLLNRLGTPLSVSGISRIVGHVARAAGVEAAPHALRRSVATHLLQAGVSLEAVRQFLGHQDLESLVHYLRLDRKELHRAVRGLDLGAASRALGIH